MQKSSQQWRDFPTIALLAAIVFTASVRLSVTEWTPDLESIRIITFLGLLLGLALGFSRLNKIQAILLTLGYSLVIIPWQVIRITDQEHLAIIRIAKASNRLGFSLKQLLEGQPVDDHLFFVALMSIIFWFTGLYAVYVLLRSQNIIAALFPSTLIILIIQYYDQARESSLWGIGFYFFFALILLGRLNYLEDRKRWVKENVFVDSGIGMDVTIITFSAIAVIVLLAWSIPSSRAEWAALANWWQDSTSSLADTQKHLDNALASIEEQTVEDSSDLYSSRLFLGEQPYQSSEVLFTARVLTKELAQRYYWKMRIYDTYSDGHWSYTQDIPNTYIPAQTEIIAPDIDTSFSQEILFTNKISSQSMLILVQQPISISTSTRAAFVPLSEGGMDVNRLLAQPTLELNETYTVKSALVKPTVAQMRQAGTNYPEWVSERYLQLPEDFSENVRELALQLAAEKNTPYDVASATTNYLRSEIIYNEKIPAPPKNIDPIEWFLIIQKEGFCNYAASANVVMLRAAGIPARLAVGFAQGERDEEGNFLIKQGNAHAWTEVYFPEIGWVEFEATSSETLLVRPSGVVSEAPTGPEDMLSGRMLNMLGENEEGDNLLLPNFEEVIIFETVQDESKINSRRLFFWGMIILLTVSVFYGIWYLSRKQVLVTRGVRFFVQLYERNNLAIPKWLMRLVRWSETTPIARAFYGINTSLRLLGAEIPPHLTPQERSAVLVKLIPEKKEEITLLLAEHEKTLFTPNEGDINIAQNASLAICWHTLKRRFGSL